MRVIRAPIAFLTSRAGQFVLLAFLLAAQNTYVSTVVAWRFLAAVGAEGIPLDYILYAVVSNRWRHSSPASSNACRGAGYCSARLPSSRR